MAETELQKQLAEQAARIKELEGQAASAMERANRVEAENRILASWKKYGQEVPPELEEAVKEKIEAGLDREQAITCAKAQFLHDAALMVGARKK